MRRCSWDMPRRLLLSCVQDIFRCPVGKLAYAVHCPLPPPLHSPSLCLVLSLPSSPGPVAGPISDSSDGSPPGITPQRALAVRLLVCFMGAVLGSRYSIQRFAEATLSAYSSGWGAAEVFKQLGDADFLQSGGLVPVSLPSGSQGGDEGGAVPVELRRQDINKQLFSV